MTQKEPLVSIMIPNYNYSQYLDECIQSAINQTYDNLEIIILDNKSTDDSMQIIRKYNDSRIRIGINSYNIFNNNYKILSDCLIDGKYAMTLCSDDAIEPDFIKMAVDYMEKYPNVAYVHGERSFIEPDGTEHLLSPFFKCSFRAEGVNMMPIYMVTTVAHASQGVFRLSSFRNIHGYDIEVDHMNLDRSLWFFMSYQNEYIYLQKKMARIRISPGADTSDAMRWFQHPILYHMTINDFIRFARQYDIPEVYNREEEAIKRLSIENIGYAMTMLGEGNFERAQDYLTYSYIHDRNIISNEDFKIAKKMIDGHCVDQSLIMGKTGIDFDKKRFYDPPIGYEELDFL